MSCTKEGKSVSACRFARDLQQHVVEVQSVNRLKNGTLLLRDDQITKIMSLNYIAGLQVKVEVYPTLNIARV